MNDLRVQRDRHKALSDALDRQSARAPLYAAARVAVQIYDGGMIPSTGNKYFLGHPGFFTGDEVEGGTDGGTFDAGTSIVVFVLGTTAPSAGDILTAYAVGGRWVAEKGGSGGGSATCSPCDIPKSNLTVSWVNVFTGNGSTTMTFTPVGSSGTWVSGCSDGLIYTILCTGGQVELQVIYFVSGSCPTGTSQFCSNLQAPPFGLTLSSYTCSPFSMTFTETSLSCPALASNGYVSWTVTG